ncbi:MAG: hypothetical protein CMJ78_09850 [Planctomycetaceae bacterium]|nr:hypothetical protein [Planctomycetaceae bacterium]
MSQRDQRNASTLVALVGVLFVSLCMIGISALVMPQIAAILLVFCGFVFVGVLHYVTWGRWLTRKLRESHEFDDDEDSASPSDE